MNHISTARVEQSIAVLSMTTTSAAVHLHIFGIFAISGMRSHCFWWFSSRWRTMRASYYCLHTKKKPVIIRK